MRYQIFPIMDPRVIEFVEAGWRAAVIAGFCVFAWSVSSSLDKTARALTKQAEQSTHPKDS
jgi:hypothetical protein